ncbi:carboxypeptidase regulatory-like domain-containing protein [Candidatus Jorgensenbacteria bacterium]|nr:carboxypeptidase regulatory-like domain-containing protein [Candidatus Jorgensenbacteria bacterium]
MMKNFLRILPLGFLFILLAAPSAVFAISVSNLRIENIYGSGAQVKWTTDAASDSKAYYGTSSGNYSNTSEMRCDAGGSVTEHCINLMGLSYSTVYYYKVRSSGSGSEINSTENSFLSGTQSYSYPTPTTSSTYSYPTPDTGLPAAPTNFIANLSGSNVFLGWSDNSYNETQFQIYRRLVGLPTPSWPFVGSASANSTNFNDYIGWGLPSGTYEYKVVAYNSSNSLSSGDSNIVTVVIGSSTAASTYPTPTDTGVPAAPTNLAVSVSGSDATLSWFDNAYNETEFKIYRRLSGTTPWSIIGSASANSTNYKDGGLGAGTYEYHVNAYNSSNLTYSIDSNIVSAVVYSSAIISTTSVDFYPTPVTTSTYTTSTSGGVPSVAGWGLNIGPDKQVTVGISFNVRMDPSTFIGENVFLFKASDPAESQYYIPASIERYNYYVNLKPNTPLVAGVEYVSIVKARVKSAEGTAIGTDYICRFNALSSGYYTSCPISVISDPTKIYPTPTQSTSTLISVIAGIVSDASGAPVPGAGIHLVSDDFNISLSAISNAQGAFRVQVVRGNYRLEAYPPYGRGDLLKSEPITVGISAGETKNLNLRFTGALEAVKVIAGTVRFSDGMPVTDARVGAWSGTTGQWTSGFSDAFGKYSFKVAGGVWVVGVMPADLTRTTWRQPSSFFNVEFMNDSSVETKQVDFQIVLSDGRVDVKVVDGRNAPLSNVGVVLGMVSGSGQSSGLYEHPNFRKTDVSGIATFIVPVGRYYIRAFLPDEFGRVNPDEQIVDVIRGVTSAATLVFKKQGEVSLVYIRGTTKFDNGSVAAGAFVWAWSERGGFSDIKSNERGEFIFSVPRGTRWHIGAGKELDNFPYKSDETTIDVNADTSADLILTKTQNTRLAQSVTVNQASAQTIVAQANDGAKVVVPPNAAAVSGNVEVEIVPTVEAPSQPATKVVSTVYDVTISDQAGKEISTLQSEVEITIPYDESELKSQGVSEDAIIPSYFDEATGVWVKVESYTIDKDKNIVIIRVKHLTRFAIVAAADTVPPLAPTNIKVVVGVGELIASWVNPDKDFDHIKIYRSNEKGKLGTLALNNAVVTEYHDRKDLVAGLSYYYTVRAVDPAGNESTNTDSLGAVLSSGTPLSGIKFNRILKVGSRGNDVKLLQETLIREGVYPESIVTGYFGNLTKLAVIRFQEKYLDQILKPVGLASGTGVVGNATRAKLNSIIQ